MQEEVFLVGDQSRACKLFHKAVSIDFSGPVACGYHANINHWTLEFDGVPTQL